MPHKNPERKRLWEREHCEKRNAVRRRQRLKARSGHQIYSKASPDPVSDQNRSTRSDNKFVDYGVSLPCSVQRKPAEIVR